MEQVCVAVAVTVEENQAACGQSTDYHEVDFDEAMKAEVKQKYETIPEKHKCSGGYAECLICR